MTKIIVLEDLINDQQLIATLNASKYEYVLGTDIDMQILTSTDYLVTANFFSDEYKELRDMDLDFRIIGPPVIYESLKNEAVLPDNPRPLYCNILSGAILCFSGFDEKLGVLASKAQSLGTCIRAKFCEKTTHLIAKSTLSSKYRRAVVSGVPIMSSEWIHQMWEMRDEISFNGLSPEVIAKYRLPSFYGCAFSLMGFSADEVKTMSEMAVKQGGSIVDYTDPDCHCVVVAENVPPTALESIPTSCIAVRAEWFWTCIQTEILASVQLYPFCVEKSPRRKSKNPHSSASSGTPRRIKRRRLQENLAQLAHEGELHHDYSPNNVNTSLETFIPQVDEEKTPDRKSPAVTKSTPTPDKELQKNIKSKRYQIVQELLQTETNYCAILNTIIKGFKEPIECKTQPGGPILKQEDIKTIFGSVPPLLDVHLKIKDELSHLLSNWSDTESVGKIFKKHSTAMLKAYPSFVNFYETVTETISNCEKEYPRFHAFLQIMKSRPECDRSKLTDLMIRPVQRVPHITLLLSDLLKRTDSSFPDFVFLQDALDSMKSTLSQINEAKRHTASLMQMFEITQMIDGVPPNILSAHRRFICKVEVCDLSNENLVLFLFNDLLEITKKKTKTISSPKNSPSSSKAPSVKSYKHSELLPLIQVKRIVDIEETEEFSSVFCLVVKPSGSTSEKLYTFILLGSDESKSNWLSTLGHQVAETHVRVDVENILTALPASELNLEFHQAGKLSIQKALKVARKASLKWSKSFGKAHQSRSQLPKLLSSSNLKMNTTCLPRRTLPTKDSTLSQSSVSLFNNKP